MKTFIATAVLTLSLLSAGAFGAAYSDTAPETLTHNDNVTVIEKNNVWPAVGPTFVRSCDVTQCFDI